MAQKYTKLSYGANIGSDSPYFLFTTIDTATINASTHG